MIEKLVSDLPEIYQPIHGHPELSGEVSRSCIDRLEHISRIHNALKRLLGRPLKVLDLGCAQGFFSLNLAERGSIVHGVDFLDKNIAVCNALALENSSLHVSFETGRVEGVIDTLQPGQYDLVLGLSVLHHIVHEKGAVAVKAMLERVAKNSGALIVELALREEPLYWAAAQPENPLTLLDSITFVHEVARHATHLAPIPRPLFVASNRYWILEDLATEFERWSLDPHALALGTHAASRRYFIAADSVLKLYRFDHQRGDYNKAEFDTEVRFLQQPPKAFSAPLLMGSGERDTDGWLVMQRLPGRLLLDLLREGVPIDSRAVLLGVLEQLATLEAAGLYHDDVRTWNVLLADDGATHLIDYGSISAQARDCVWPHNPFLSFFIFVREVSTGIVDDPNPSRTISTSPHGLPQPYRAWATSLWKRPLADWSFQLFHQTLRETPDDIGEEPLQQPMDAWMVATEEAIQTQMLFSRQVAAQIEAKAQQAEAKAQQAEAKAQQAEAKAQQAEAASNQALTQLQAVYSSTSWHITSPLRWVGIQFKLLKQHGVKGRLKAFARKVLPHLIAFLRQRPTLKRYAVAAAYRLGIAERLRRFYQPTPSSAAAPIHGSDIAPELHNLTPHARQIYRELKNAIENKKALN